MLSDTLSKLKDYLRKHPEVFSLSLRDPEDSLGFLVLGNSKEERSKSWKAVQNYFYACKSDFRKKETIKLLGQDSLVSFDDILKHLIEKEVPLSPNMKNKFLKFVEEERSKIHILSKFKKSEEKCESGEDQEEDFSENPYYDTFFKNLTINRIKEELTKVLAPKGYIYAKYNYSVWCKQVDMLFLLFQEIPSSGESLFLEKLKKTLTKPAVKPLASAMGI